MLGTLLDIIAAGLGQSAAQATKGPPLRLPEFVLSIKVSFIVFILYQFCPLLLFQFSVMDKSSSDYSVLAPPKATARCHPQ
jgi:hypothetical protein